MRNFFSKVKQFCMIFLQFNVNCKNIIIPVRSEGFLFVVVLRIMALAQKYLLKVIFHELILIELL